MIILYTTPSCPKCMILKDMMDKKKIKFQEANDLDKLLSLGIKQVPVLEVDNKPKLDFKAAFEWIKQQEDRT